MQGEQIQAFELQQALFQFGLQNRIPAELMETYSTQILDNMLLERATLREAERLGLQVSEEEVVQQLRRIPDFFPDGNFVGRQAYEDLVYTRFHVTLTEFERQVHNSILREKLRSMITDPVVVYPEEIRKAFEEDNEKMVLEYALIDTAELREDIEPSDEELQEYYQTNQARYQIPEKRSGQAIVFDELQTGLGITIEESELQAYYRNNQNDFRIEERVQVSHILLRADESNREEVRTKGEDLLTQLQDGADFAELARENSEDPASAASGGDLGWVVRGQTVPPFEQAAFSLEPGEPERPGGNHLWISYCESGGARAGAPATLRRGEGGNRDRFARAASAYHAAPASGGSCLGAAQHARRRSSHSGAVERAAGQL